MTESAFIRKLIRIALLTTPLIAVITMTPVLLMKERISTSGETTIPLVGKLLGIIFLIFFLLALWTTNIGLFFFFRKKEQTLKNYKFWRYCLSFIGCYILAALILQLPPPPHLRNTGSTGFVQSLVPLIGMTASNGLLLIILDLLILKENQTRLRKEISELTVSNIIAQNEQLKGQIHPHFLFNSLSTLKTLIKVSSNDAENYIINLSGYLRSAISYTGADKASLRQELNYCQEYLEMQKVRFGESLKYEILIPENIKEDNYLPVFSLQLLAENAIKHNVLTKEKPIVITISLEGDNVAVKNNIVSKRQTSSTGLGLKNLSKRVELLTNSEKEIGIYRSTEDFHVSLPLIR